MVGEDYSSKFSAWLALGCISPRTIYQKLKDTKTKSANESTYWLVFELLWRDFSDLCSRSTKLNFLILRKTDSVNSRSLNEKLVSQWINGATDSDFINANMLELKQTGFMSNREDKTSQVIL
jgi:deoxyribodipyrimidine photo-lyase